MSGEEGWRAELERWLEPFLAELNHAARRATRPHYIAAQIGLGERKSMQLMASRQDGLSLGSGTAAMQADRVLPPFLRSDEETMCGRFTRRDTWPGFRAVLSRLPGSEKKCRIPLEDDFRAS